MNEPKHTPGPWEFGVRDDGSMWLSIGEAGKGAHYQGDLVASKQDAQLICAAPELLSALKELSNLDWKGHRLIDRLQFSTAGRELMQKVLNAIAKAEQP